MSVAVGAFTVTVHVPVAVARLLLLATGAWLSLTVTKKVVELFPQELDAVTVTGVTPLKKA